MTRVRSYFVTGLVLIAGCAHAQSTKEDRFSKQIAEYQDLDKTPDGALVIREGKGFGAVVLTPSERWQKMTVDFSLTGDAEDRNLNATPIAVALLAEYPTLGNTPFQGRFEAPELSLDAWIAPGTTRVVVYVPIDITSVHIDAINLEVMPDVIQLVQLESPLMSEFHGEPWFHKAYVTRPEHVDAATPFVYEVSGFVDGREESDDYNMKEAFRRDLRRINKGQDVVVVRPNVGCEHGHHVMLDSEVNGPVGTAFVTELLPYIDEQLAPGRTAKNRYLTGHSSGGWTVVHLMLNEPDAFALGLATAPDPLDLRVFHEIDIYGDANAFVDETGEQRVFGRNYPKKGAPPTTWRMTASDPSIKFFPRQMISYEAAFGVPDAEGQPRKLFDRATGEIDLETAKAWQDHDLKLRADELEAAGDTEVFDRLWIVCGTNDNFGLHEGVQGFGVRGGDTTFGGRGTIEWIEGGNHWEGSSEAKNDFYEIIIDDVRKEK